MNRLIPTVLALSSIVLMTAPAAAQNAGTNGATSYYAPLYNTPTGPSYYTNQGVAANGAQPIFNNAGNVPPVPLQQMIAGRNAPSYNFGGGNPQPYTFGNSNPMAGVSSIGSLSPEQASYVRAQQAQAAQAQQYNNGNATQGALFGNQVSGGQYGANLYQPQMQGQAQQQQEQQGMNMNAFALPTQQQQPQVPTQRKVVYKERNNPLKAPPRLFDPDR